jgi:hypothetical protein
MPIWWNTLIIFNIPANATTKNAACTPRCDPKGKCTLIPWKMALRLGKAFNTTPELWLNMQRNYDLWQAGSKIKITHIRSHRTKGQRAYRAN